MKVEEAEEAEGGGEEECVFLGLSSDLLKDRVRLPRRFLEGDFSSALGTAASSSAFVSGVTPAASPASKAPSS